MTIPRLLLLAAGICAASFVAEPSWAQPPPLVDAKELARADQLFADANTAYNAKDLPKARELYLEAYKVKRTYDIAGHLGRVELELGLYRDAAEHLADCIRNAPPHQGKKPFERVIEDLERAKKEIGTVMIAAPEGAIIYVDGREAGKAPLNREVFVETGRRRFEAKLGEAAGAEEQSIVKGQTLDLAIRIEGQTTPDPKNGGKDPVVPLPEPRPMWPGWVMGGVGLVAAGVGAGLIGVGQTKLGDGEELGNEIDAAGGNCRPVFGPMSERCGELTDALDSAGTLTTSGIVVASVGGALLIGGIIYLAVPDEGAEDTARITPWLSPDLAGITFSTSF